MTDAEPLVDEVIAALLARAQADPASVGRVSRHSVLMPSDAYAFPGYLFPDGRARALVSSRGDINVPAIVAQLELDDVR